MTSEGSAGGGEGALPSVGKEQRRLLAIGRLAPQLFSSRSSHTVPYQQRTTSAACLPASKSSFTFSSSSSTSTPSLPSSDSSLPPHFSSTPGASEIQPLTPSTSFRHDGAKAVSGLLAHQRVFGFLLHVLVEPAKSHLFSAELDAQLQFALSHAVEKGTLANWGASLLCFHCWCDTQGIPQVMWLLVDPEVLLQYLASLVGRLASDTCNKWLSNIKSWHAYRQIPWMIDVNVTKPVLAVCKSQASPGKPSRHPVLIEDMEVIMDGPDFSNNFNIAVWGAVMCAFWGLCKSGEVMVALQADFDPERHIQVSHVLQLTSGEAKRLLVHFPWEKVNKRNGTDIVLAEGTDQSCPVAALQLHVQQNCSAPSDSLFSYNSKDGMRCI